MIKEHKYFVSGMHCASCELLVEKKLLRIKGVKSVEASAGKGEVIIEYEGSKPEAAKLNQIFKEDNYCFSENVANEKSQKTSGGSFVQPAIFALLLIIGFLLLGKSRIGELISVNSNSSLPMFFAFGLLAGISSCAALVGGMVLSLSKQWSKQKTKPHLLFNAGRLLSYAILGGVLGGIGNQLQLSLSITSVLVIAVSILMLFIGLQMLGVKALAGFSPSLPRFVTRYIANEDNFHGEKLPFLLGAATFFLPCGFTITAQGLALLSGDPVRGSLIMTAFALGTLPTLLIIGFSSVKFFQNPHLAEKFSRVAGVLILFFAIFNLNSQFNLLGLPSLSDFSAKVARSAQDGRSDGEAGLPPVVGGKQVIKMDASSSGYIPNSFKVRVGVPVRWEITDKGTSGCTNAVISKSLFDGSIGLTPGETSVKEFTPTKEGKYKFSCWMGMISGVIEVVGSDGNTAISAAEAASQPISSGASGCGCGGGSK